MYVKKYLINVLWCTSFHDIDNHELLYVNFFRITCVMNLKREGMKVSEAKNLQKLFYQKK